MKTDTVRINQLSDDGYAWYLDYLSVLDSKDIDAYAQRLATDVELVMNNNDPIVGRDAVAAGLGAYWQSFGALEHELINLYGTDHAFVLEALNHYTTHDGRQVSLRAVAFTDRNDDGEVTSVRLYTDTTPLFTTA